MKQSKRILRGAGCVLAAILCAASVCGCTAGGKEEAPLPSARPASGAVRVHLGSYQGSYLEEILAACKKKYPDMEVQVDGQPDGRWDLSIDSIRAELMSGGGPDILFDPHMYFDDIDKTMNTNVFADLSPFIRQDFGEEGLNPAVLKAGERGGRQYVLPLTYNMPLLLTTEEILAEAGVDAERCGKSHLDMMEEADRYIKRTDNQPPFYSYPFFAMYFPDLMGLPFLDYEKRGADFSFPEYKRAVELYKDFYPYDIVENDDMMFTPMDGYLHLKGREAVFEGYHFNTGEELFWSASALGIDEMPLLVPMAAQDGKNSAWIYQAAAVPASSKNQENAWSFLTVMLSPEIQNNWYNARNLPVRASCLEDRISSAKADADGTPIDVDDGQSVTLQPLPESFYESFRQIVDGIGHTAFTYAYASQQTLKSMRPYYEGKKSFESCFSELENSAAIYMTE